MAPLRALVAQDVHRFPLIGMDTSRWQPLALHMRSYTGPLASDVSIRSTAIRSLASRSSYYAVSPHYL